MLSCLCFLQHLQSMKGGNQVTKIHSATHHRTHEWGITSSVFSSQLKLWFMYLTCLLYRRTQTYSAWHQPESGRRWVCRCHQWAWHTLLQTKATWTAWRPPCSRRARPWSARSSPYHSVATTTTTSGQSKSKQLKYGNVSLNWSIRSELRVWPQWNTSGARSGFPHPVSAGRPRYLPSPHIRPDRWQRGWKGLWHTQTHKHLQIVLLEKCETRRSRTAS